MLLKYKNQKFNVLSARNGDYLDVSINGKPSDFLINKISNNEFTILNKEGQTKTIFAAKDDKHIYVIADNFQYVFDVLHDDETFFSGDSLSDDKHENILSPMPGSIVKVVVKVGDKVEEGDAVIIIEAMKMETKLYSSISGIVNKINCSNGEQIDTDMILVEIIKE